MADPSLNPFTSPKTEHSSEKEPLALSMVASDQFSWRRMLTYCFAFAFGTILIAGFGLNPHLSARTPLLFWMALATLGAICGGVAYTTSWIIRRTLFREDDTISSLERARRP